MSKINIACVIDDDKIYTFAVKKMLEHSKVAERTLFFPNGKIAIDFFKEYASQVNELPDLILLDLNMPILDGWQFLDEFIKLIPIIDKKITVYIVSSSIDQADWDKANAIEQVSGFIIKPITINKLKEITDKIDF